MLQDDLEVTIKTVDVDIIVEDVSAIGVEQDPDVLVVFAAPIGPQGAPGFVSLPAQTEVPAAGTILTNVLLRGDAQPSYRLFGSGKMEWGAGGVTAPDVNLYRSAADTLKTDDMLLAVGGFIIPAGSGTFGHNGAALTSSQVFYSYVVGDAQPRFRITADGRHYWGNGSSALDTGIWRGAVGGLYVGGLTGATKGTVRTYGDIASDGAFQALVNGDSQLRWSVTADGIIRWGLGNTAADTNLYRSNVNTLKTDGAIEIGGIASGTGISVTGTPNPVLRSNVPAGNSIIFNKLLSADAQPAFRILGDGKMEWGLGGASALDTKLYRSAAGQLKTDGRMISADASVGFYFNPTGDTGYPMYSIIGADAQPKFRIGRTGAMEWGPGGSTIMDTTLIRFGPGVLQLGTTGQNGGLRSQNMSATDNAFMAYVQSDLQFRFHIRADGMHWWGTGSGAVDTNLYRLSAGQFGSDNSSGLVFQSIFGNGYTILAAKRSGDTQYRFRIQDAGAGGEAGATLQWGPGGSTAPDTNLYRSAAGVLKTDGVINAVGGLQINGVPVSTGGGGQKFTTSPLSGGPPASPADGDIWIATFNDAYGPIRWQFQYNASAPTYKWEFIGGPPAYYASGAGISSASTTFTDWLAQTVTRSGEYQVTVTGDFYTNNGTNNPTANIQQVINGTVYDKACSQGGSQLQDKQAFILQTMIVIAAGQIFKTQVQCGGATGSQTAYFGDVDQYILPRRIA